MNNKYTQFKNKNVSRVPKKAKNKPSYYLVLILLILTFLGSILGAVAFMQNNVTVASADTIIETIDLSLNPNDIYNEYGSYQITSGVSARTSNENLKNFGINGFNNSYAFDLNDIPGYPCFAFNSLSSQNSYYFFITLNDFLSIDHIDIINFNLSFDTVDSFDIYFLNSQDPTKNTNILNNSSNNDYNNSLSGFTTTFNIIRFVIYSDIYYDNNYNFDNVFYNFGITIDKVTYEDYNPTIPSKPTTSSEFENIIDLDYSNINYSNDNDIYEISTGVTTNTGNTDIKNLGIKNYNSEDFNNFYLTSQYDNALYIDSIKNYYDLFFTFAEPITVNVNDTLQFKFVTMYKQNAISQLSIRYLFSGGSYIITDVVDYDNSLNGLYINNWVVNNTYSITGLQVSLVFDNANNIDNEVFNKYLMVNLGHHTEPDLPDVPDEPDVPDVPNEPDVPDVPDVPIIEYNLGIFTNAALRYRIISDEETTGTEFDYSYLDTNFTYDYFIDNFIEFKNITPYYNGYFSTNTPFIDETLDFKFVFFRWFFGDLGVKINNSNFLFTLLYSVENINSDPIAYNVFNGFEPGDTQLIFWFNDGTNFILKDKKFPTSIIDLTNYIGKNIIAIDIYNTEGYLQGLQNDLSSSLAYSQGYAQGNTNGFNAGYNDGYKKGEVIGYGQGYNDGASAANEYTFLNLFSSLFDAPIKAFTSLFNFEVFGQNLTNFFLALITFAVAIKIIALLL